MGILGLVPFLQKIHPEVIRVLPNRLKDISGKTVVFDGTLVTQRLHYSPSPLKYRHVLGWYNIIKELKDAGVRAICVFDGKERSAAKQLETQRRKQMQKQELARASLELDRLQRLKTLFTALNTVRDLSAAEREKAASSLRQTVNDVEDAPSSKAEKRRRRRETVAEEPTAPADAIEMEERTDRPELAEEEQTLESAPEDSTVFPGPSVSTSATGTEELTDSLANALEGSPDSAASDTSSPAMPDGLAVTPPTDSEADELTQLRKEFAEATTLGDHRYGQLTSDRPEQADLKGDRVEWPDQPEQEEFEPETYSPEEISSILSALYRDYRASVPTSPPSTPPQPSPEPSPEAQPPSTTEDPSAVFTMSKNQLDLIKEEGKIWQQLIELDRIDQDDATSTLASLTERSALLSDSYQRRTDLPTTETYDECKELIVAMGLPLIEVEGPFEAEALASSVVVNGLADYVVTEDTDVLAYEAPMLRNITSRDQPLQAVSGIDVRAALELDRCSYIDFILLCGTDFSQRIKNVGPVRALDYIQKYGSIERIIETATKNPPPDPIPLYLERVDLARLVFQTLPPLPTKARLKPRVSDDEEVERILRRYELHKHIVESIEWNFSTALLGNHFNDNPSAY